MSSHEGFKLCEKQFPSILDIVFKLSEHLMQLWNFFAAVSGLIVGWLLSSKESWSLIQQLIAILLYAAFLTVNGTALFRMYRWMEIALLELNKMTRPDGEEEVSLLQKAMSEACIPGQRRAATIVYSLTAGLVIGSILYLKW